MQKEGLDKYTKQMIIEDLELQQERLIKEREENLALLGQGRPALSRSLVSKVERIQKFVN